MQDFNGLELPSPLRAALEFMKFTTPTPIQAQSIPPALDGKDVLGTAQTGTGKTAAFGIPLVAKLMNNPRGSALVLTPTRELALQVITVLHQLLGKASPIRSALLIGGEPMGRQFSQLRGRPRLIVGTPGRINDHLARGTLLLHDANFLVLDETDRMLDMGFGIQLEQIEKYLAKPRQTLMFSATLPGNIMKLAQKYLQSPVRVAVGSTTTPAANIKQEVVHTTIPQKYQHLRDLLDQREGAMIVFVKTKIGAEELAQKLYRAEYSVDAIHGDLRQSQRDRVIRGFRNRKFRILIATDIAARGLDIPHVEHVINFDLPQCPEDYVHRIGRTARAGAEGEAICLITPQDGAKWRAIRRLLNPNEQQESSRFEKRKDSPYRQKPGKPFRFKAKPKARDRNAA
jgi:ATP-dependent RNA helicase DeaD